MTVCGLCGGLIDMELERAVIVSWDGSPWGPWVSGITYCYACRRHHRPEILALEQWASGVAIMDLASVIRWMEKGRPS